MARAVWQLMLASFVFNALETAGTIVWATAKQRHVPASLLGRVSSLDWLISIGLAAAVVRAHRPGRGRDRRAGDAASAPASLGAPVTFGALFLPGMRAIEGAPPLREDEPVIELAAPPIELAA